jgi:catechol 2,3-dioxygenase-like lactoylglutathione lyase family enzyme
MNYPIHHLTLSISAVDASAVWYQALFGAADVVEREGEGWRRTRLTWPAKSNLRIVLISHDGTADGRIFSHLNLGLDHLGFECATPEEVNEWAAKIDRLGFVRGPVEDVQYGWIVTSRDPDNIPIEFYCPK